MIEITLYFFNENSCCIKTALECDSLSHLIIAVVTILTCICDCIKQLPAASLQ
jgi:hypothetical protein